METSIIKGQTRPELEAFFESIGEKKYRARQAFLRTNKFTAATLNDFTEFPKTLREKLHEMGAFPELPILASHQEIEGTEKAVFLAGTDKRDEAQKKIEAVWIVSHDRRTACISSQVGCSLNCSFCATGTLKFRGNLKAWQIVDQVYGLLRHRGGSTKADSADRLTNVVFMGMGEPFYNYEQVIKAANLLHDQEGLGLGARHITISTAGV
ncbi:MAG: 23S rRNA (adenine(2503)-C(2))-methyltransferase RlmN, partial [Leptospirales bacterium]|nr:23S rRNA (adenine(2503)-C(2))-methyltransferase RlmN [Leptospirales bacterium]